jgi:RNAse (barnase) inhibitor barstar
MAIFNESKLERDYFLMRDGAIVMYYRPQVLDQDIEWLKSRDYRVVQFDCTTWETEKDMHHALAQSLGFPQAPYPNLDGLNDYLSDIDVPENGGLVLVFRRYDSFDANYHSTAWHVLDILARMSRFFLLFGKRLMVLIQSDDPHIKFDPVGRYPVSWNSKEWLNKNRGL